MTEFYLPILCMEKQRGEFMWEMLSVEFGKNRSRELTKYTVPSV